MNNEDCFGGTDVSAAVERLRIKKGPVPVMKGGKFKISPKEERTLNGRVYDSKLEMKMHEELLRHFPEEEIKLQTKFILQPSFCLDHSPEIQRALVYKSDFVLGELRGDSTNPVPGVRCMVLDAKGMVLPSFVVSSKLFEYKFRVPVYAVKTVKQLKTYIEKFKMSMIADAKNVEILTSYRPFWVRGYINSDGERSDLLVQVVGRDGYQRLVQQSREDLVDWSTKPDEEGNLDVLCGNRDRPLLRVPKDEHADYNQAFEKVVASLNKQAGGVEEESATRQSHEEFHPLSPDLGIIGNDPEKLAVMRLRIIRRDERESDGPPAKEKKSKAATLWRKRIEALLPLGSYVHRLNLYPGKFEKLEYL